MPMGTGIPVLPDYLSVEPEQRETRLLESAGLYSEELVVLKIVDRAMANEIFEEDGRGQTTGWESSSVEGGGRRW
jgi:hypothetical protein